MSCLLATNRQHKARGGKILLLCIREETRWILYCKRLTDYKREKLGDRGWEREKGI